MLGFWLFWFWVRRWNYSRSWRNPHPWPITSRMFLELRRCRDLSGVPLKELGPQEGSGGVLPLGRSDGRVSIMMSCGQPNLNPSPIAMTYWAPRFGMVCKSPQSCLVSKDHLCLSLPHQHPIDTGSKESKPPQIGQQQLKMTWSCQPDW
jgi:hypothetical protein